MVNQGKVYVVGVGMTKFEKPGRRADFDYPDMAREAVIKALEDARITINDIQAACVGYVYGDSTCGQRAIYQIGMTGIPVYNVNNNCSTGSTALLLARMHVQLGNDAVLALGFEKMERGSLQSKFNDRSSPMEKHVTLMAERFGLEAAPITPQMFGNAGREHMKKYGTKPEHFAKIAEKNHRHSANNPYSQFQDVYTLQQIMSSPTIFDPLTKLQCCPTSDGAAAAILCSESFVLRHNLMDRAVEIVGMEMATDVPSAFDGSAMNLVGYDMTRLAANRLFSTTGVRPDTDIQVVELHDCFSANELITYEALGLCPPGGAAKFIDEGQNTYGGRVVVNPSGGLISKGHPLGATGIAQCAELCWQLRGEAGKRQVPNVKYALQHNVGLGGAVVVGLYRKGFIRQPLSTRNVAAVAGASPGAKPEDFRANKLFVALEKAMVEDQDNLIEKVRGIFAIRVKNGANGSEGYWVIDAKTGKGSVTFNSTVKPDVTFVMDDNDVTDLLTGKLNPQKAFFQGKVKIQGNMGLAMKLQELQRLASSRIEEIRSKL